jgi:hypothetical protein
LTWNVLDKVVVVSRVTSSWTFIAGYGWLVVSVAVRPVVVGWVIVVLTTVQWHIVTPLEVEKVIVVSLVLSMSQHRSCSQGKGVERMNYDTSKVSQAVL